MGLTKSVDGGVPAGRGAAEDILTVFFLFVGWGEERKDQSVVEKEDRRSTFERR